MLMDKIPVTRRARRPATGWVLTATAVMALLLVCFRVPARLCSQPSAHKIHGGYTGGRRADQQGLSSDNINRDHRNEKTSHQASRAVSQQRSRRRAGDDDAMSFASSLWNQFTPKPVQPKYLQPVGHVDVSSVPPQSEKPADEEYERISLKSDLWRQFTPAAEQSEPNRQRQRDEPAPRSSGGITPPPDDYEGLTQSYAENPSAPAGSSPIVEGGYVATSPNVWRMDSSRPPPSKDDKYTPSPETQFSEYLGVYDEGRVRNARVSRSRSNLVTQEGGSTAGLPGFTPARSRAYEHPTDGESSEAGSAPDFQHVKQLVSDDYLSSELLPGLSLASQGRRASKTPYDAQRRRPSIGTTEGLPGVTPSKIQSPFPQSYAPNDWVKEPSKAQAVDPSMPSVTSVPGYEATSPHVWRIGNMSSVSAPPAAPTSPRGRQGGGFRYEAAERSEDDLQSGGQKIMDSEMPPLEDVSSTVSGFSFPSKMCPSGYSLPTPIHRDDDGFSSPELLTQASAEPYHTTTEAKEIFRRQKKTIYTSGPPFGNVTGARPLAYQTLQMHHSNFRSLVNTLRDKLFHNLQKIKRGLRTTKQQRIGAGAIPSGTGSSRGDASRLAFDSSARSSELMLEDIDADTANRLQPDTMDDFVISEASSPPTPSPTPLLPLVLHQEAMQGDISVMPFTPRPQSVRSTPGPQSRAERAASVALGARNSRGYAWKPPTDAIPASAGGGSEHLRNAQPARTLPAFKPESMSHPSRGPDRSERPGRLFQAETRSGSPPRAVPLYERLDQLNRATRGTSRRLETSRLLPSTRNATELRLTPLSLQMRGKQRGRKAAARTQMLGDRSPPTSKAPPPSPRSSKTSNTVSISNSGAPSGAETPSCLPFPSRPASRSTSRSKLFRPASVGHIVEPDVVAPAPPILSLADPVAPAPPAMVEASSRSEYTHWPGAGSQSRRVSRGASSLLVSDLGHEAEAISTPPRTSARSIGGTSGEFGTGRSQTREDMRTRLRDQAVRAADMNLRFQQLTGNLREKDSLISRFHTGLKSKEEEVGELQTSITQTRALVDQLERTCSLHSAEIRNREREIDSLNKRYSDTQADILRLRNQIEASIQRVGGAVKARIRGEEGAEELLELLLSFLEEESSTAVARVVRLQNLTETQQATIQHHEREVTRLGHMIVELNATLAQRGQAALRMRAQLLDKNATIEGIDRAIGELHQSISALQRGNEEKATLISDNQRCINGLKAALVSREREATAMNKSFVGANEQNGQLRLKCGNLEWAAHQKSNQITQKDGTIQELRRQLTKLEWEVVSHEGNNTATNARLEQMVREREALVAEKEKALETRSQAQVAMQSTIARLNKEAELRRAAVEELQETVERLKNVAKTETASVKDLKQSLTQSQTTMEGLRQNITYLTSQLKQKVQMTQELDRIIQRLRMETKAKAALISRLEEQVKQAGAKVHEQQRLRSELESKKEENGRLKRKYDEQGDMLKREVVCLKETREVVAHLEDEIKRKTSQDKEGQQALSSLRKSVEGATVRARQSQLELSVRDKSIRDLRRQVEEQQREISQTQKTHRANGDKTQVELDKRIAEISALRGELITKIKSMGLTDKRFRAKLKECAELEHNVEEERRKRTKLEDENKKLLNLLATMDGKENPSPKNEVGGWL